MQAGRTQHEDAQHLQQCEARDSAAYSDGFRDIGMDARVGIVVSSQSQKGACLDRSSDVVPGGSAPKELGSREHGRGVRLLETLGGGLGHPPNGAGFAQCADL